MTRFFHLAIPVLALLVAVSATGCRAHFLCPSDEGGSAVEPDLAMKGPADAPVVIEEFSEFQCPYCRRAAGTIDDLMTLYPGKIRLVYRHFPLDFHTNARGAAHAALAAHRQGRFWEFHDALFSQTGDLTRDGLITLARKTELDIERFQTDMDDPGLQAAVSRDLQRGQGFGVRGVPNFRINGRPLRGAQALQAFQEIVDEELDKAAELLAKGEDPSDVARILTERNTTED